MEWMAMTGSTGPGESRRHQWPSTTKERHDMTFIDKAKDLASKAGDKASQVAGELAEKAGPLAEKAAPLAEKAGSLAAKGVSAAASGVDKATGGKYHDRIETVTGKLGEALNRDGHTDPTEEPKPDHT
jgi:hypothetical protein